ncbi:MAG: hypothetical protein QNK04_05225 [Myxococcota bacterium]|nr:hypothetical protein [Myxococcota bacterium]
MLKLSNLGWVLSSLALVVACQTDLSARAAPANLTKAFNDTSFQLDSCEITPDRTAICRLTVTNRFRDKKVEIDRRITIQDDLGTDHAVTAGGFGDESSRPQWNQVAVADSSYDLTVVATNLSTRATAIRAVIFTRLLVRSTQGQALGYRDQAIFSNPPMVASTPRPPPETAAASTLPAAESADSAPRFATDRWYTVGYWNYDAADGQHLAKGLVLQPVPGNGGGQSWQDRLELRNHATLRPRSRSVWPVKIHAGQKRVCADYPDYPSYSAFVDMPGESQDGVYLFARCRGE